LSNCNLYAKLQDVQVLECLDHHGRISSGL